MTNGRVVQRANIGVGYDRYNVGGAGDVLMTSGLANCVAIIARNPANHTTVMAHFDTNSGRIEMSCLASLQRFRTVLQDAVGSPTPAFQVIAGIFATAAVPGLQAELTKVFGVGTVTSAYTVSFNIDTATATTAGLTMDPPAYMPTNWETAGTDIDYTTLTATT